MLGFEACLGCAGERAEQAGSQDASTMDTSLPADSQPTGYHTDTATTFPDTHQMRNSAPDGDEHMLAEPLTSNHQQGILQQQAQALPPGYQPALEESHFDGAQEFASQHSVRNAAPSSNQSMFAAPLTADSCDASSEHAQRHPARAADSTTGVSDSSASASHDFAAQHHVSNQAPSAERAYAQPLESGQRTQESEQPETGSSTQEYASQHHVHNTAPAEEHAYAPPLTSEQRGDHSELAEAGSSTPDFASQHHVHNAAPAEEHAYAQPLTSEQQGQDSEQTEANFRTEDVASQHHVRNAAPAEEHPYAQPLTSEQQRHQVEAEQHGPGCSTQDFASQHAVQNSAPGDERAYPQPLTSDQPESQQGGIESRTHAQDSSSQRQTTNESLHEEHANAEPVTSDQHRHQSGSRQHQPEPSAQGFASQHNMQNEAPAAGSLYAQPLTTDQHQDEPQTDAQTDSHSSSVAGQQDFASQHSVRNEPPSEESLYSQPLSSDQHRDRADSFPADSSRSADADSTPEQDFASQHSVHNEATAAEPMYGQPLTSEQQSLGTQSSQRPMSRSGDQTTSGDLGSVPYPSVGEATSSSQQTGHTQATVGSEQEGYASQQQSDDEDAEIDLPAAQVPGTDSLHLRGSEQQEQQPSLTGKRGKCFVYGLDAVAVQAGCSPYCIVCHKYSKA